MDRRSSAIFAVTGLILFSISAVYHRGNWSPHVKAVLKRIDHTNIMFVIAGTYTPLSWVLLPRSTATLLLTLVWAGAVLGTLFRILWVGAPRWLYVPLYIALGWAAAFVVPQLLHGAGVTAFVLMAVGGFC